jgi:hypothetical protein
MPAMADRVTSYDFTPWSAFGSGNIDLDNLDLFMHTDFSNSLPAYAGPRYSIPVDTRLKFTPDEHIVSGSFPPVWAHLPFLTGQLAQNNKVVQGNMLFDTGAQVSILSTQMAIGLGLDSNLDGVLDSKDANYARAETISGIGGSVEVPVFLIDQVHIPTSQGPDLVWTDLQWLVLDIIPGIDAIFGFDNMTSGWIETFSGNSPAGYIKQSYLDFRNWSATGRGSIYYDINPDIFSVVDLALPWSKMAEEPQSARLASPTLIR